MSNEKLLSIKDACTFLNVKESWLRSKIFKRQIRYIKLYGLIRFEKSELEKWIELARK